jgi:flagellar hook-associated protein FlgK
LDNLAKTLANEINKVHSQGIDGYGKPGGDLFKIQSPPVRAMDGRIWRVDVRRM